MPAGSSPLAGSSRTSSSGECSHQSFVVLTAHAGALGATLRVDAPEHVEPGNYAQTLTSHAANDDKATASYVVVYTDENQDSYPYAAHVAALVSELAAARMPVRNVWLVTSTHWTELDTVPDPASYYVAAAAGFLALFLSLVVSVGVTVHAARCNASGKPDPSDYHHS